MSTDSHLAGLAVRRIGYSHNVELCDLRDPLKVAIMSWRKWIDLQDVIRIDPGKLARRGDQVAIEVKDDDIPGVVETVYTTEESLEEFRRALSTGRFEGLAPADRGQAYGPWISPRGVIDPWALIHPRP